MHTLRCGLLILLTSPLGSCGLEDEEEFCYEHTCNGDKTGHHCFGSHTDYCSALCAEDNCAAEAACQSECI